MGIRHFVSTMKKVRWPPKRRPVILALPNIEDEPHIVKAVHLRIPISHSP